MGSSPIFMSPLCQCWLMADASSQGKLISRWPGQWEVRKALKNSSLVTALATQSSLNTCNLNIAKQIERRWGWAAQVYLLSYLFKITIALLARGRIQYTSHFQLKPFVCWVIISQSTAFSPQLSKSEDCPWTPNPAKETWSKCQHFWSYSPSAKAHTWLGQQSCSNEIHWGQQIKVTPSQCVLLSPLTQVQVKDQ